MKKVSLAATFADKKTTRRLRVGTYHSRVISVAYSEQHTTESAIEIKYQLTAQNGETFDYSEYFFLDDWNSRSRDFSKYLAQNGINPSDLTSFVGHEEELVLKKSTKGPFLNIDTRVFLK